MKKKASLKFLGTGGSMGVPVIGCGCPVCTSGKSVNERARPSVLISSDTNTILIDCGPDFRWQALKWHIKHIDGVILTHAHNDHTAGFDDLRLFYFRQKAPVPCLLSPATEEDLKRRFYYIFDPKDAYREFIPKFAMQYMPGKEGKVDFLGLPITYFTYEQGGMQVNGLRFGNLAYVTDIRHYDATIFDFLKNLDTLIVSALRFTPSPLHLDVNEAVEFAGRVGAKQTFFTHIAHDLEHDQTNSILPPNIRLAYDGLQIEFTYE